MTPDLVLGSASERRRWILEELSVQFSILVPEVSEVFYATDPQRTALENCMNKHRWCAQRRRDARIITADTVIDFDGGCVAKPISLAEAIGFLQMFSGRRQTVITAAAFSQPASEPALEVAKSDVVFRQLTEGDIKSYFARVDPLDKAGGYDIGEHGDEIIESFSGSRTNIMGLPRHVVENWLRGQG